MGALDRDAASRHVNARDEIMDVVKKARKDDDPNIVFSRTLSVVMRIDSGEIHELGGRS